MQRGESSKGGQARGEPSGGAEGKKKDTLSVFLDALGPVAFPLSRPQAQDPGDYYSKERVLARQKQLKEKSKGKLITTYDEIVTSVSSFLASLAQDESDEGSASGAGGGAGGGDGASKLAGKKKRSFVKPQRPSDCNEYSVRGTDTLAGIALRHSMTVAELKSTNHLTSNYLYPGQVLFVRKPAEELNAAAATTTTTTTTTAPSSGEGAVDGSGAAASSSSPPATAAGSGVPSGDVGAGSSRTRSMSTVLRTGSVQYYKDDGVIKGAVIMTPTFLEFEPDASEPDTSSLLANTDHGITYFRLFTDLMSLVDCRIIEGEPSTDEEQQRRQAEKTHLQIWYLKGEEQCTAIFAGRFDGIHKLWLQMRAWTETYRKENQQWLDATAERRRIMMLREQKEEERRLEKTALRKHGDGVVVHHEPGVETAERDSVDVHLGEESGGDLSGAVDAEDYVPAPPARESDGEEDYVPELSEASSIMSDKMVGQLAARLPARFQLKDWVLLYSMERDGISINTMYHHVSRKGPNMVVVKDTNKNVFGAYTSESWKVMKSYYGTGETFLFTWHPVFRVYPWTRDNDFFMLSDETSIACGAGGKVGLYLDEEFLHGSTGRCGTFANDPLSNVENFQCAELEVWGFQGMSE